MKQKIIDLATELFMKQGYLATSTRQIAKELNITQPALYHHYKNKEQIYIEVLKNFSNKIGIQLHQIIHSEPNNEEALIKICHYLKDSHPMNFSMMMHDMNHELDQQTKGEIFIIWHNNYFLYFEQLFERFAQIDDLYLSPKQISSHFLRGLSAYIVDKDEQNLTPELPIEEFVKIFLHGIIKK
ncbi:TetR/AcrR family transcriptional regulator [Vagococcus xieshaowenii]|uniref:TetR/AcrR family transcriptional regulator n=1 Tax=Vagococcus xieshaowenii TaxID=2562451 RepID=A0AAJ5JMS7_9ENTE|nr:TetR/AcrR family transcriptional regulator [Vagococcus xieshaowenii]QCA28764.1 TetR/AcrR family transcriptional regulator [Vagococcus xieshaowenii]TFZ43035.1 TetR/AcrR family transcriptional regulator [Vagococcus xieshaowenii]